MTQLPGTPSDNNQNTRQNVPDQVVPPTMPQRRMGQVNVTAAATTGNTSVIIPGGNKELEPFAKIPESQLAIEEIEKAPEVPAEIERLGVRGVTETVEVPPDLRNIGVTSPHISSTSVALPTQTPAVVVPLSDDQIFKGLHASISSSLRWLATWCIKQLKKAHIILKEIHGKIIRIKV